MSSYTGDYRIGKTVRKMWATNAVAGESITRGTNGTISVYKDGGTTQSTAGVTDTEDFDGLTGVHLVAIDTSADGTFYSAGSDFEVVLSGASIDSKTINTTLFSFSLENRSALMPTTDGQKLTVSGGTVSTVASVTALASGAIAEASFATTAGSFAPLAIVRQGTAQSATDTEIVIDAGAAFGDNVLVGDVIGILGSTQGYWQFRDILSNVGATDTVTVDTLTVTPSGTLSFKIFGGSPAASSSAAAIRSAVGMASANLDTQLSGLDGKLDTIDNLLDTEVAAVLAAVDTEVAAIKTKTDQLTFGVTNTLNANITHVIADPVQTNGATDTNWGGAP